MLRVLANGNGPGNSPPHIIGGCAVVRYGETPGVYSGLVHIGPDGRVLDWYGKMHRVMFGEYIPLIKSLPWVRDYVPVGLGIDIGPGPRAFRVGELSLCANICIETAVERFMINHLRQLRRETSEIPNAIVTVANDGWFDDSSVVEHHKRCGQLLAVACRRPILSSANNGPTAWIDSCGRVVEQLPQGSEGFVPATPRIDNRICLAVRIGDWPARLLALSVFALLIVRPKPSD